VYNHQDGTIDQVRISSEVHLLLLQHRSLPNREAFTSSADAILGGHLPFSLLNQFPVPDNRPQSGVIFTKSKCQQLQQDHLDLLNYAIKRSCPYSPMAETCNFHDCHGNSFVPPPCCQVEIPDTPSVTLTVSFSTPDTLADSLRETP
jgi:hypothetical protein